MPIAAVASPPPAEGLKRPRRHRPRGGFPEDHQLDPPSPSAAPGPRPAARRGRAGGLGVGFTFFGDECFPRRRGVAAQHRQRFWPFRDVRPRRALVGLAQNAQAFAFRPEVRVRLGLGQAERHDSRGRVVLRAPRRAGRGEIRGHRCALRSLGSLVLTGGEGQRSFAARRERIRRRIPTGLGNAKYAQEGKKKRPASRKIEAREVGVDARNPRLGIERRPRDVPRAEARKARAASCQRSVSWIGAGTAWTASRVGGGSFRQRVFAARAEPGGRFVWCVEKTSGCVTGRESGREAEHAPHRRRRRRRRFRSGAVVREDDRRVG